MTEGTVLAWGLDAVMVHREDGTTHMIWWVTPNYAGQDKVFAAFEELDAQISAEDQERFRATVEGHHDHILRSLLVNVNEETPAGLPYTNYATVRVKRGKGREWRKLFDKYNKPVLDTLVADGTLIGYGIDVEDFHTEEPGLRLIWILAPNLGAFDKVDAAFAADRRGRSEEERAAIGHQFRKVTVAGAHRDYLYRSIIVGGQ